MVVMVSDDIPEIIINSISDKIYANICALDENDCCVRCRHDEESEACGNCNSYDMRFEISRKFADYIARQAWYTIKSKLQLYFKIAGTDIQSSQSSAKASQSLNEG